MSHYHGRYAAVLRPESVRQLALVAGFGSDEALARAAGLSVGHLWQCLAGRRAAGPKVLTGLLRALPEASLDELIGPDRPGFEYCEAG